MTTEKIPCWECEEGFLKRVFEDFETMTKDGSVIIPNTPLLKCPKCGDSVFDTDATEHIEKHLPPYVCRSSKKNKH